MLTYKNFIFIVLSFLALGFILGWLFPVEGPVDYIYDNYRTNKATKLGPPQKEPVKFSEEELDYINEMLMELREGE